jgi:hypothetical protein
MSIIIRLQRLPLTANAADVRQFFFGLRIPQGQVHIIGGDDGDAFIGFATDEDARQAMRMDGRHIHDSRIKLFLSSRVEMDTVIAKARAGGTGSPGSKPCRSPSPPKQRVYASFPSEKTLAFTTKRPEAKMLAATDESLRAAVPAGRACSANDSWTASSARVADTSWKTATTGDAREISTAPPAPSSHPFGVQSYPPQATQQWHEQTTAYAAFNRAALDGRQSMDTSVRATDYRKSEPPSIGESTHGDKQHQQPFVHHIRPQSTIGGGQHEVVLCESSILYTKTVMSFIRECDRAENRFSKYIFRVSGERKA